MIVERSMTDNWLSNTYLVAAGPGTDAFVVDAGGPMDPLFAKADEHDLTVTHILLTHHHHDHVVELGQRARALAGRAGAGPPRGARCAGTTGDLQPGDEVEIGGLTVRALHTPGHTAGMLSLLVERSGGEASGRDSGEVFTGDTLFKGSVGGVRAPGSTSFADIKHSIMEVLLALPPETVIRPGHTDPTTVAEELESNPFVRVWRGEDPEGDEPLHGSRRPGDAGPVGPGLRRRAQGLGALGGRARRHRPGLAGRALTSRGVTREPEEKEEQASRCRPSSSRAPPR